MKRKLHKNSGVFHVGINVKEKNGSLAQEKSFCVYSNRKLSKPEVPPVQMAHSGILGYPTDEFLRVDEERLVGFSDYRASIKDG